MNTIFLIGGLLVAATTLGPQSASASGNTADPASFQAINPDGVSWVQSPLLPGVASATVVGEPGKPGVYVVLGKMQSGAVFPPHSHPDARITTVISGTMYYGAGPDTDRQTMRAYPTGTIVYTPPGVVHSMWSKDGETIMQETGYGPTGLELRPN